MVDDIDQAVDEMLDQEQPEAWRPETPGDQISGVVLGYSQGMTSYGEKWICNLERNDGTLIAVWLLGGVLQSQFAKMKPRIGETIGVRYLGTVPSKVKGHKPYHDFKVVVVGRSGQDAPDFFAETPSDEEAEETPFVETEPSAPVADDTPPPPPAPKPSTPEPLPDTNGRGDLDNEPASQMQIRALQVIADKLGMEQEDWSTYTRKQAGDMISSMQA